MDIAIRIASMRESADISAVLEAAFGDFEPLYTPQAYAATVLAPVAVAARMAEGRVWAAVAGDDVVGTVAAVVRPEAVLIRGTAVHPCARGARLGRRLLDEVESFAREQGIPALYLYTAAFLTKAIALYSAEEYRFTGDVICPDGVDLLRMAKSLE